MASEYRTIAKLAHLLQHSEAEFKRECVKMTQSAEDAEKLMELVRDHYNTPVFEAA